MSKVSSLRVLRAAGALALVAVGAVGTLGATQGSARAAGSYQAGAAADGLRLTISSAQFPVAENVLDLTAPKAQASSGSTEQQAFASYPFPGDLAAAAPGLLAGLAADQGQPLPFALPGYPLSAAVRCGGDTRTAKVPDTEGAGLPGSLPYTMTSACTPTSAEARASSGSSSVQGGVGLTLAHVAAIARAGQDTAGTTTAVGTSEATGINVGGGLLQLSGLVAIASATVNSAGAFTPTSSFTIGTLSVAGAPASFGPTGFTSAGGQAPLDVSAVNSVLKSAGIELTYISETRTKTSITSAGLAITMTQKDPQSGVPIVTRYLFGQVSANASAQSFIDSIGSIPAAAAIPAVGAPPADEASGAAAPTVVDGVAAAPSISGDVPSATDPPSVDLTQAQVNRIAVGSAPATSGSVLSFYLVLVLAGTAIFGSSGLASYLRRVVP